MIAVIEIPQGSLLKYEVDKSDGLLFVDRVLNQPIPYNYGYIPNTLCGDGDPLDVFVLGNISVHPLSKVKIELLGVLHCIDNGEEDDKLIAIIQGNEEARTMGTDIIRTYLQSYKAGFQILSGGDVEDAAAVYEKAKVDYAVELEKSTKNSFYVKGTSGVTPV